MASASSAGIRRGRRLPGELLKSAAWAAVLAAVRASLWFSPRPAALMIRAVFRRTGAAVDRGLAGHAPEGIERLADEPYGDGPDAVLDVYHPTAARGPAPTIVWVHGGAFVGGSKEELRHWFELLADGGVHRRRAPLLAGAGIDLPDTRAPGDGRPRPRVHACGTPARRHPPPGPRGRLCGRAACRPGRDARHEPRLRGAGRHRASHPAGTAPWGRSLLRCVRPVARRHAQRVRAGRALGVLRDARRRRRPRVRAHGRPIPRHFPPVFVTAGNADPLLPQTTALVERLDALGVETDTLLFPPDTSPPLGHEYQFLLDTPAGREALSRILAFLARRA